MPRSKLLLAACAVAGLAMPALASAQPPWVSIHDRELRLESRIDDAVRAHRITRDQAMALRGQFRDLEREEARDRATRPGLTQAERADLDRRFDALAAQLNFDKRADAGPPAGARPLDQRRDDLSARIDRAERMHRINRREAAGLRADLDRISRDMARDRATRPGLTPAERDDLNRRMDRLSMRIHDA